MARTNSHGVVVVGQERCWAASWPRGTTTGTTQQKFNTNSGIKDTWRCLSVIRSDPKRGKSSHHRSSEALGRPSTAKSLVMTRCTDHGR